MNSKYAFPLIEGKIFTAGKLLPPDLPCLCNHNWDAHGFRGDIGGYYCCAKNVGLGECSCLDFKEKGE